MAWGQTGDGRGGEGWQLLALLAIAFAVNIPLLALVMLVTGDTEARRALILSLVGILAGGAANAVVSWMRTRRRSSRL